MSFIQRLVVPAVPTALAAHTHVDLPGYDLWLHNIDNVHVLPAELDVSKFEEALSKVLQLYPHAAGQLRCSDGRWSIELTNTAIPVDIDYKLSTSSGSLLDGDWVIQDDISPFLNHQPVGANLVNGGAPLLRLKLTFFENETCIGVSWHHTLGDATVLSRFMHTLSQFYQGLPSGHAHPTFKKYDFPIPSRAVTDEFWPHMPHIHDTRPFSELAEAFSESMKNVEHLRWRFDDHDTTELRSALSARKETPYSRQDCLTAYLVAVLNHNSSIPLQKVTNTSSYRNISASFIDEDVASNPLLNVVTAVPADIVGVATAIRRSLIESREPEYIHNWMAVASTHMLETANAGRSFTFAFEDNSVTVNSNVVIDWCSAHFGYPDGSRFHSTGTSKFYMRYFKSNPTKGGDGVWRASQSVDVSMGVLAELRPKLLETLSHGIQYVLDKEPA